MLKDLKINGEIKWCKLTREDAPWDEREHLKLRVK